MRLKIIFQLFILIIIASILIAFYYTFFKSDKEDLSLSGTEKKIEKVTNKDILNELVNLEYNAVDEQGNSYYINAERAIVDQLDQTDNIVKMEGVVAIVNLKNRVPIFIYSKNAKYNKINNNTFFYNDIKINYLDKTISAENLDLIFTDKISTIYNNVIFNSDNYNLYTDRAIINMISGDIKLGLANNSKKVTMVKK